MANFTVRVELHGIKEGHPDYEKLHAEMTERKFKVTSTRDGKDYALPHAEYRLRKSDLSRREVADLAEAAVAAAGRSASTVVVTGRLRPRCVTGSRWPTRPG